MLRRAAGRRDARWERLSSCESPPATRASRCGRQSPAAPGRNKPRLARSSAESSPGREAAEGRPPNTYSGSEPPKCLCRGFPSVICHTCQPQLGVCCFLHILSKVCLSIYRESTFIHPPRVPPKMYLVSPSYYRSSSHF